MGKFKNNFDRRAALIPIVRLMLAEGKSVSEIGLRGTIQGYARVFGEISWAH